MTPEIFANAIKEAFPMSYIDGRLPACLPDGYDYGPVGDSSLDFQYLSKGSTKGQSVQIRWPYKED